ncbi:hypothetical protein QYE76_039833 [Lolium multiflorum]|uniref:Uncharacterized protein n=1 Tax=Lolium multiflorum TaxID=4521 RepID=A0AAD8TAM2_LOLMU|nr:hypothetical protein QYE76_039833 [Lolium multiflorum]
MCVFQLTRNVFLNPDVRISKSHRQSAVLENAEEGERYSQHAFRRYVSAHRPEVFPAINRFFSESGNHRIDTKSGYNSEFRGIFLSCLGDPSASVVPWYMPSVPV